MGRRARPPAARRDGLTPGSAARAGFVQAKSTLAQNTPGSDADKRQAVTLAYHGTLAPPFCLASARGFFQGVLAAGG